jgi:hypothetical protein
MPAVLSPAAITAKSRRYNPHDRIVRLLSFAAILEHRPAHLGKLSFHASISAGKAALVPDRFVDP